MRHQIGVLFLPVMIGFGLAFVLVSYSRLMESPSPLFRLALLTALFLLSALPMVVTLLPESHPAHEFPPYFEPAINKLGPWTKDDEIIASDMPWAVAWVADRKSLWIPIKLNTLMGLSDDGKLSGPLAGVFITPISRNAPFVSGIYKGEYQDYLQIILGNTNIPNFPFKEAAMLLGDLNYTFYSDTRRWDNGAAPQ